MFRPDRESERPALYLEWRVRLVGAGAILAAFGIASDVELLRWAALAVLVAAAALSIMAKRNGAPEDEDA